MRETLNLVWLDDNLEAISNWAIIFEEFGFNVRAAGSAEVALAAIMNSPMDLVLADLNLPGDKLNGIDFIEKVRELDQEIPVFIVSGFLSDERYRSKLDELKLSGLISKPLPPRRKDLEKILVKLELACQEADVARLQRKYGRISISEYMLSLTSGATCFILSPLNGEFDAIYEDIICKVLSSKGIAFRRADEIYGVQPIIEDVEEAIMAADFLIAELTGRNPNVFYELGLAHATKKPVILLTQNIGDVPFDLKHRRCIIYLQDHRGIQRLESDLSKSVDAVIRALPEK